MTWVRTWSAAPQKGDDEIPAIADATVRQDVQVSCGGSRVRIRFSNEYGGTGITIGAATVNGRPLTFGGRPTLFVPAGAPAVSDPLDLDVPARSTLTVAVHLPGRVDDVTGHNLVAGPGWLLPGEQTTAAGLPASAVRLGSRVLLSGVDVLAAAGTPGVVAVGASVTDGAGATGGGWPERFAARFASPVAVANQGISGNRLLNDGFGASILARLDRDVLALPGVTHLILLAGMNDIGFSIAPGDADPSLAAIMRTDAPIGVPDVTAAYRQVIDRAHTRGLKVYGATLTPYGGSDAATPPGEKARQQINDWIRTSGAFDAVLDFDAVWRDPSTPDRILEPYDMGDHMHGTNAGYQALADSIDLTLFT